MFTTNDIPINYNIKYRSIPINSINGARDVPRGILGKKEQTFVAVLWNPKNKLSYTWPAD